MESLGMRKKKGGRKKKVGCRDTEPASDWDQRKKNIDALKDQEGKSRCLNLIVGGLKKNDREQHEKNKIFEEVQFVQNVD